MIMDNEQIEQRLYELEAKWLAADKNGEQQPTNAQELKELSIQALIGLAQISQGKAQSSNSLEPDEAFGDWLRQIAERYYMTDHEVATILAGQQVGADGGNSAWYGEFQGLWRWWQDAHEKQLGRDYSDWHDGLVRVLTRMPSWRERRAVAVSRKAIEKGTNND